MELLFRAVAPYIREWLTTKMLLIMKMVVLLLTVACLQISARTLSQTISLSEQDAPLEKIFKEIERQTNYHFFYRYEWLKDAKKVSIQVKGATLQYVLDKVFKDQPLTYVIIENNIAIKLKEENKNTSLTQALIDIRGKVINEKGEPIAGATIQVKGTNRITLTDDNGEFQLNGIAENAVLIISSVSFETREVKVERKTDLSISLKIAASKLETVNVTLSTGYQSIPKERATGSFAQPDKQMFDARVSTDVLSKLDGITSGVLFNPPGLTGSRTRQISIRGRSTIFADDQPLIVVDNFPFDGDINSINPNDVESVTVLKDAAAASIWGVRAGNGVIVITTKQGRFNQGLKIALNANVTISEKPNLSYNPNFLNSSEFIDVEKMLFGNGFYDGSINDPSRPVLTPVVEILNKERKGLISANDAAAQINALRNVDIRNDLNNYFYRRAANQQYALNFSGGDNKGAYYFSVGYDKNLLSQKANEYSRITLSTVNTFTPIKNLIITGGINYIQNHSETDNTLSGITGAFNGTIYPYAGVADQAGNPSSIVRSFSSSYVESAMSKGFLNWEFYPLEELGSGWNTTTNKSSDMRITAGAKYSLPFGLSAEIKYQYEKYLTGGNTHLMQESFTARNIINQYTIVDGNGNVVGYNVPPGSILQRFYGDQVSNNFRGQLNYNNSWTKHSISAIIGAEAREIIGENDGFTLYGYNDATATFQNVNTTDFFFLNPIGAGTIPAGLSAGGTTNRFRSYFGNAAYTYNDKYTLSLSGRIDGSNFFGVQTNKKNVPLWSAGVKWDLDKESFYKLSWLPYLKLRATYGYSGNLDKTVTAVTTFAYSGIAAALTNAVNAYISNVGNPELRWEQTAMVNIGLDFGFNKNIVSGSVEYFHKKGVDLMGDEKFAPNAGITQLRGNFANMKGNGMDIRLVTRNIDKAFQWTTSVLFSWATDKVTSYKGNRLPTDLLSAGQGLFPYTSKPVYGIYSYKWGGLDPQTGDPLGFDTTGKTSKDYPALINPTKFSEIVYNGPARPVFFGGITNHFSYRAFTFSVSINYKLGYYFRRSSIYYTQLFNNANGNKDFSKRWQKPGDEINTIVPSMIYPANPNRDLLYYASEALVEKGDHIRLQDISLSYNFDKSNWSKLPLSNLQFYVYANNIGILWRANKEGLDPDYPIGGVPSPRTIAFGIKANF